MAELRPFCEDLAARKLFDRWAEHLRSLGLDLGESDHHVVGIVASRQAILEGLRVRIAAEKEPSLRLVEVELRAAAAFMRAVTWLESTLG